MIAPHPCWQAIAVEIDAYMHALYGDEHGRAAAGGEAAAAGSGSARAEL